MRDKASSINERIAARAHELRTACNLSLEALSEKSGVSRSMISLIERGESSPTAAVLEKLASGLGVTLATLFNPPAANMQQRKGPVATRKDQPEWKDPASGYLRRNITPAGASQPMQIVEVIFPPGSRVVFENNRGGRPIHQQVWILGGKMNITLGKECHKLTQGDCLAMRLDGPIMFHNPTRKTARYVVVIADGLPSPP
jgi:transcriptional regulator with XRE-family HTH domain